MFLPHSHMHTSMCAHEASRVSPLVGSRLGGSYLAFPSKPTDHPLVETWFESGLNDSARLIQSLAKSDL
jgi:hypothetical protein